MALEWIVLVQGVSIIGLGLTVLLLGVVSIRQSRTIRRLSSCIETMFDTIKKIDRVVNG